MVDDAQGADAFVVQGYFACARCGDWVVTGTQYTALHICTKCAIHYSALSREHRLRYEVDGRVFLSPQAKKRPKKKRTTKDMSPEAQEVNRRYLRLWNRARSRALVRLQTIYRPMFEVLMAEERGRVGLPADYRSSRGPGPTEISRQILDDLADAEERRMRETSHRQGA